MDKQQIIDYIRHTPNNSNVNVVKGMLENSNNDRMDNYEIYRIVFNCVPAEGAILEASENYDYFEYTDNNKTGIASFPIINNKPYKQQYFDLNNGANDLIIDYIVYNNNEDIYIVMPEILSTTITITGNCTVEGETEWNFNITGDCTITIS